MLPCPQCERHVRLDESACPFCNSEIPSDDRNAAPDTNRRMSRAAAFVFASVAVACGSTTIIDGTSSSSSSATSGSGSSSSGSSGSTSSGMSGAGGAGASTGVGGIAPAYGAPAVGGASNTGGMGNGGGIPLYGAAPFGGASGDDEL
jgi:hypothetical protein